MNLFVKKPVEALLREAKNEDGKGLRRVLGPWGLIALGIGVIIGAGLFSVTGVVAGTHAGPAITLSFVFAAIACAFAGLCYAEFASMIPVAGSAYTYSYATMGELIAWIIGWDLVLEYTVAAITVSISWSQYFVRFLAGAGIDLPHADGLPVGRRHCQPAGGGHRTADERLPYPRHPRERLGEQHHRLPEGGGHLGVRRPGVAVHPFGKLHALPAR